MHHAVRRMRRAARRLELRRPGGLRWTVLVSLLGHVVALVLVKLLLPPADAPDAPLVVERWHIDAPDAHHDAVSPPRRAPDAPTTYVQARAPTRAPELVG